MAPTDKVFVTGGTGLVGRFLLKKLVEKGYKNIHAIYRSESSIASLNLEEGAVHWHKCDILDPIGLEMCMENSKWVFHAAAQVSFDARDLNSLMATNVEGTQLVVETARVLNVERFCHVSSVSTLGRDKKNSIISEKTAWSPENASWYAKSKYAAEQEVWRAFYEGLDVVIVNPSIILGPGKWKTGSSKIFYQIWNGLKFYATGKNGFVDVRDVADFMLLAMKNDDCVGQKYVLSADNWTYKKLFTLIANQMGIKPPSIAVNGLIKFLSWRIEYIRSLLTNSRPLITKETAHTSSLNIAYDNQKSKSITGFVYNSIEKTVEYTVAEFKRTFVQAEK